MKIAISNIAWRADEETAARTLLESRGVRAVEVAPSKIGPKPAELSLGELRAYRDFWGLHGIEIVAMQALLFGRPDFALFGTDAQREELRAYLAAVVRGGGELGARALVFGSPKNRLRGTLANADAARVSAPFWRELGQVAVASGTCLCIEPNPPEYGADWIHSAADARTLVEYVAHPGFGLHLDAAALMMAREGAADVRACGAAIRHFHASEVQLAPVRAGTDVPHAEFAAVLRDIGYANFVSIEMRQAETSASNLPHVERALDFVLRTYGDS